MEVIKWKEQILGVFLLQLLKIHDDHIEEDMFIDEQRKAPINHIVDEQPEQPQ